MINPQRGDTTMKTRLSTPTPRHKPGRRSPREWHALIQAFSHSGVTRSQFCTRHGLALSTFDWWRSRLRRASITQSVSNPLPTPANALFVEIAQETKPVAVVSARWDVELDLGHGLFLRLRREAC
jgi:hypothetical protein